MAVRRNGGLRRDSERRCAAVLLFLLAVATPRLAATQVTTTTTTLPPDDDALLVLPALVAAFEAETTISGQLENVSRAWIEGWACEPANAARRLVVNAYATGVPDNGDCITVATQRACRIASGTADQRREPALASRCGGDRYHGFALPTSNDLLAGGVHQIYALAADHPGGIPVALTGSPTFDANVFYRQEAIAPGAIDDHLLVNGTLPNSDGDLGFLLSDHTLVDFYPLNGVNAVSAPLASNLSASTGVDSPLPRTTYQRGGVSGRIAVQAFGGTIGLVSDNSTGSTAQPEYGGVFLSFGFGIHPWVDQPRPWRLGVGGDHLRVEGFVRHPLSTYSPPAGGRASSLAVNFIYFTVQLRDTTTGALVWFTPRFYQSRYTSFIGLQNAETTFVDYGTTPQYAIGAISPILAPTSAWVTPCPAGFCEGSSHTFTTSTSSADLHYCFEVSPTQLHDAMVALNAEAAVEDASRNPGETRLGPVSTNATDWAVNFFNVNVEEWAFPAGATAVQGLSVHDLRISRVTR